MVGLYNLQHCRKIKSDKCYVDKTRPGDNSKRFLHSLFDYSNNAVFFWDTLLSSAQLTNGDCITMIIPLHLTRSNKKGFNFCG